LGCEASIAQFCLTTECIVGLCGFAGLMAQRDASLRETLRPMIGLSSRVIAAKLNELGIAAPRGGA